MRRVIKVGGSLLLRSTLIQDLNRWIDSQPAAENWLIVGGGELIDAIRQLDQRVASEPAVVHWRCVDLLHTTYQFMGDWFPQWATIDNAKQFRQRLQSTPVVEETILVAVRSFYFPGAEDCLPRDWRTTTDAIAGLLAIHSNSDELVLLKSCDVDPTLSMDQLASTGVIDDSFLLVADRVRRIRIERLEASGLTR